MEAGPSRLVLVNRGCLLRRLLDDLLLWFHLDRGGVAQQLLLFWFCFQLNKINRFFLSK
jgi:hypothetical protein